MLFSRRFHRSNSRTLCLQYRRDLDLVQVRYIIPKYFDVDEAFDRAFLALLEEGDPEKVVAETTLEKMAAAGDGGTTELLSWIVAMGAVGDRKARTICYEPAVELRCGMGCVWWDMAEEAAAA